MRRTISFTVAGVPIPQGSKNPWGGESNPKTRLWRGQVSQVSSEAMRESHSNVLMGPVKVTILFAFPRPKSHFRTGKNAHLLRDDAPYYKQGKPDLDKLQRAIGDSLTGVAIRDDSQIVQWESTKIYDDLAYAEIIIIDLSGGSQDDAAGASVPGEGTHPGEDRS